MLAELKVNDLWRQVTHILLRGHCSFKTSLIKGNVRFFFFYLNMRKVVFPAFLELPSSFVCISHFKILCNIIDYSLISLHCGSLSNCLEVTSSHGVFFWAHNFTWSTTCICFSKQTKNPPKPMDNRFLRIT